jgi:hypothetical protein
VGEPVSEVGQDYERLPQTVAGLHYFVAFACLMVHRVFNLT